MKLHNLIIFVFCMMMTDAKGMSVSYKKNSDGTFRIRLMKDSALIGECCFRFFNKMMLCNEIRTNTANENDKQKALTTIKQYISVIKLQNKVDSVMILQDSGDGEQVECVLCETQLDPQVEDKKQGHLAFEQEYDLVDKMNKASNWHGITSSKYDE